MKIILNASNLRKGGSLQVGLSFINELHKYNNHIFYVLLSYEMNDLIKSKKDAINVEYISINTNPTKNIINYLIFNFKLRKLENKLKPDFIISVFGPIYWTPKSKNITGFALGYYVNEETYFFKKYKLNKKLSYIIKKFIHKYFLKHNSNLFWVETNVMKHKLSNFLNINKNNILISSNSSSNYFDDIYFDKLNINFNVNKPKLLYISSYYIHKGFEIIPQVDKFLKSLGVEVQFIITIDTFNFKRIFDNTNIDIINTGPVHPRYCPYLYSITDIVFAPTLLETFSAVFPEAMKSRKPIITTDFDFIRDICKDAALYFNPQKPEEAANLIKSILENKNLYNQLIQNGDIIFKNFDSSENRFRKILNFIENN